MKQITTFILLVSTSILSWAQQLSVDLNLTGFANETPVYLANSKGFIAQEKLINNQAQLTSEVPKKPDFYNLLIVENGQYLHTTLYMADEQVTVEGDRKDFPTSLTIKGSKYDIYREQLNAINRKWLDQSEALDKELGQLAQQEQTPESVERMQELMDRKDGVMGHIRENERTFILDNFDTPYAQAILPFHLSYGDKVFCQKAYDKLSNEEKSSTLGEKLKLVAESPELKKGTKFIDFSYRDLNGNKHQMSENFPTDKKYVLIEFSNINCGYSKACVAKTQQAIAKPMSDVVVYAIWEAPKLEDIAGLGALESDHTHFGFVLSEELTNDLWLKYGVVATPSFFLLDSKGTLIDKWNGVPAHEEKIKEYFIKQ